jgi:hypothetical protein
VSEVPDADVPVEPRPWLIAAAIAVFIAGLIADLIMWWPYGWVLASGAAFWLAVAVLVVAVGDLVRPPARTGRPAYAQSLRVWARKNHAWFGAAGLILGGIIGHVIWRQ